MQQEKALKLIEDNENQRIKRQATKILQGVNKPDHQEEPKMASMSDRRRSLPYKTEESPHKKHFSYMRSFLTCSRYHDRFSKEYVVESPKEKEKRGGK